MAKMMVKENQKLDHSIVKINKEEVTEDLIDKVTFHMEEVLLDKAYYSIYKNYQTARNNGLKVVLNGQGSDEVWLGYLNTYAFLRSHNEIVHKLNFQLYWEKNFPFLHLTNNSQVKNIIENNLATNFYHYKTDDYLSSCINFSIKTHLQSMLMQEDRLSMANGVECRVPFVDYRIIEKALSIPSKAKIFDGREKYLLREVAKDFLPSEIVSRKKSVFPDLPSGYGTIADDAIKTEGLRKSFLINSLFSKKWLTHVNELPPIERWKIYTLYRFENVFFS
jgi:asparagine synthase (glutamine-hydrolysing)